MKPRFVAFLAICVSAVLLGLMGTRQQARGALTGPASNRALTAGQAATPAALSVDSSVRYQTIDGFGVNANPKNWGNPAYPPLKPALDFLVQDLGANLWRVDVFGTSTWEAVNDDADPFHFNWTYYDQVYASPPFQSLWSALQELNAQGIQPILSASGVVPNWMGGTTINNDDEFVEMYSSLLYYARFVKGIRFSLADPLNETDHGPPEGPLVDANHFDTILGKLRARLALLGMSDVRLVTPQTTGPNTTYDGAILADPSVAPYVAAFAAHRYSTADVSAVVNQIKASSYPQADFWMTEYSSTLYGNLDVGQQVPDDWAFTKDMTNNLFSYLATGASAAMVWDAYDNVHDHSGNYTYWGLLNTLSGYTPKKRYFGAKQVFAYVSPGSVRISASLAMPGVQVLAFTNATTGQLTIVGMNQSGSDLAVAGAIANLSAPAMLSLFVTTATLDGAFLGNVPVTNGAFTATIPADSVFTLTGNALCPTCPTNTPVPPPTSTPSPTATPAAASGSVTFGVTASSGVNDTSDFGDYNGSPGTLSASGTLTSLSVYVGATPAGAHIRLALYTSDASGNPGTLITQTGEATATVGWNTLPVPPGTMLAPGTYWILAQTDNAGTVYLVASGLSATNFAGWTGQHQAYGPFVSSIATWTKLSQQSFAMYGTVLVTASTATPTATITPKPTPTPCGPDTNGNGIPDCWESRFACLSGLSATAVPGSDPDGDGLTTLREYNIGTNPCNPDTDGDGYSDGRETQLGKDPLTYCAIMRADINGDGIVDGLDLSALARWFLQQVPPVPARVDQNGDNHIDGLDLNGLARAFSHAVSECP